MAVRFPLIVDTENRTPENTIKTLITLMWYPATTGWSPLVVGYIRDENNRIEITEELIQAVAKVWADEKHVEINDTCERIRDLDERYDYRKNGERVNHHLSRLTHDVRIERITSPTTGDTGWRLTLKKSENTKNIYSLRTGRKLT